MTLLFNHMMFIIALFLTSTLEGPALFSWFIFPFLSEQPPIWSWSLELSLRCDSHRSFIATHLVAGGGSRQIHRAINGADMKRDPDNGYAVLSKATSFTDFVLSYVKVTLKRGACPERCNLSLFLCPPGHIFVQWGRRLPSHGGLVLRTVVHS